MAKGSSSSVYVIDIGLGIVGGGGPLRFAWNSAPRFSSD